MIREGALDDGFQDALAEVHAGTRKTHMSGNPSLQRSQAPFFLEKTTTVGQCRASHIENINRLENSWVNAVLAVFPCSGARIEGY